MKITGVKTTLYQVPPARRSENAPSPAGDKGTGCLIEVETDEDITGIAIGGERVRYEIDRLTGEVLVGQDPRGVTGLWQRMMDSDFYHGRRGRLSTAAAALDAALWDLKAKAYVEPLWKTLGAARPRANAYISDPRSRLSDAALTGWYETMTRDYGFREGKLRVGLDLESDIRRLERMKQALAQEARPPVLMIDADEYWAPKQAIRKVREMERNFDLTWVEAPAPRWDFPGHKRVSDSVRAAVCSGRYLDSHADFLPHFLCHSLDVVQINPARLGITGALQLADAAYGYELPVTLPASHGNLWAHLAGAMPYFMSLEVRDPEPSDGIFATDVHIKDGWALIGDRPGNGLVVDHDALAEAAIDEGRPSGQGGGRP